MSADPQRLVHMANQIAQFFAVQPGQDAAAGVADHLRAFWDPRMRKAIIAHLHAGGEGLSPLSAQAVALLEVPTTITTASGRDHTATAPGDDAG